MSEQVAHLIEVFRKALMKEYANAWTMERCAEVAHVVARAAEGEMLNAATQQARADAAEKQHDAVLSDDALWAELERRGAAVQTGYCYPAMCSDDDATKLVQEHGYAFGPFQLIEMGDRLAEPPQWPMFARVPEKFRVAAEGEHTE